MNLVKMVLVFCLAATARAAPAQPPLKVLFIGNSQTQCYDLPQMIKLMSESAPADCPRIAPGRALLGGKGLKGLWEAEGRGAPRAMIAGDKWDYVVIQEIYSAKEQAFREYATKFDDEIKKAGSKTVLFATANVSQYYHAAYHYPESFKQLNEMQVVLAKQRQLAVAAAGYAWMKYLGPDPSEKKLLDLYHKDKGHPGAKGTYLYACALYAAITGKSPHGLTSEFKNIRGGIAIAKDEAAKMQKAAWEQYQENLQGNR